MRHSFAPFDEEAVLFLMRATGIDYSTTDFSRDDWLCVTAREDGKLLGVCCFEFKVWFDAYFTVAVTTPRCVTRRVLRAMFGAVFAKAVRVTAEIEPGNDRAVSQAISMGFEPEGFKRLAIEGQRDALLFGMTKDRCRFLKRAWRGSSGQKNEGYHGHFAEAS